MSVEISVIIPVYNVETYLRRCLDSVCAQSFRDFEVICVDDASSDNSYQVLYEYSQKIGFVHIIKNERNRGLSYTRNIGLEHANGRYVYFLDSDDAITPDCLKKSYDAAEKTDADIIVFGAMEKCEKRPDVLYTIPKEMCNKTWNGKKLYVTLYQTVGVIAPVQFKLWRKEFLSNYALRFYEGIYHEDLLFYFESLMFAQKVVCISDVLYLYYRRKGSITCRKKEFKHIASFIVIIEEMKRVLENNCFDPDFRDALLKTIADYCIVVERDMFEFGFSQLSDNSELFDVGKKNLYDLLKKIAQKKYRFSFTDEQCDILKSFEHVLVYGAGKIAKIVISELVKHGINDFDVVVSSIGDNDEKIYNYPVRLVSELDYPKNKCIVIVAVGEKLVQEIKAMVAPLGYKNVFSFC